MNAVSAEVLQNFELAAGAVTYRQANNDAGTFDYRLVLTVRVTEEHEVANAISVTVTVEEGANCELVV